MPWLAASSSAWATPRRTARQRSVRGERRRAADLVRNVEPAVEVPARRDRQQAVARQRGAAGDELRERRPALVGIRGGRDGQRETLVAELERAVLLAVARDVEDSARE